jgi:hypothetical protein
VLETLDRAIDTANDLEFAMMNLYNEQRSKVEGLTVNAPATADDAHAADC